MPAPDEPGHKDTSRVPGQVLRITGGSDGAYGRFVYRCRPLEHEDTGMARPSS